jgi:hypothetical protein
MRKVFKKLILGDNNSSSTKSTGIIKKRIEGDPNVANQVALLLNSTS